MEMDGPCSADEYIKAPTYNIEMDTIGQKESEQTIIGTWRRTMVYELKEIGKTWYEMNWLAQDRADLRRFVDALCSSRS